MRKVSLKLMLLAAAILLLLNFFIKRDVEFVLYLDTKTDFFESKYFMLTVDGKIHFHDTLDFGIISSFRDTLELRPGFHNVLVQDDQGLKVYDESIFLFSNETHVFCYWVDEESMSLRKIFFREFLFD